MCTQAQDECYRDKTMRMRTQGLKLFWVWEEMRVRWRERESCLDSSEDKECAEIKRKVTEEREKSKLGLS